jgi:pyridoxine kinase
MRILAISSQVAWGPVGLTAAVPALQAQGHEVVAIPTITLSNHPGHGKPAGFRTAPQDMAGIIDTLDAMGVLAGCDAILTGYFATAQQVDEAARAILAVPSAFVLVDPVIGDNGALYVPEEVAAAVRDLLLPLASCITPNAFELAWLSGQDVTGEASAIVAAHQSPAPEVLATSVPEGGGMLTTLAITEETVDRVATARRDHVPHGTGDFLSGLYLAQRLVHPPATALRESMAVLERAIDRSAGSPVLDVAGALHGP